MPSRAIVSVCSAGSRALCVSLFVLALISPSSAEVIQHIHYAPTSLPSAQGWDYSENPHLQEVDAYAIVGDLLVLDTIGDSELGFSIYSRDLIVDPAVTHVSASIRVRMLEITPEADDIGFILSLGYAVPDGPSRLVFMQLSLGSVDIYPYDPYAIDASQWHDYTITMDLATAEYRLYVDGVVVRELTGFDDPNGSFVLFGDGIIPNNAHAEIASLDVWLSSGGAVAVESRSLSAIRSLFGD